MTMRPLLATLAALTLTGCAANVAYDAETSVLTFAGSATTGATKPGQIVVRGPMAGARLITSPENGWPVNSVACLDAAGRTYAAASQAAPGQALCPPLP
ncbi:MAG: hypothetical protein ACU0BF_03985 [Paracoccaceae bacterium]